MGRRHKGPNSPFKSCYLGNSLWEESHQFKHFLITYCMMTLGTHLFCLQDDRPVDQSFQNNVEQKQQCGTECASQTGPYNPVWRWYKQRSKRPTGLSQEEKGQWRRGKMANTVQHKLSSRNYRYFSVTAELRWHIEAGTQGLHQKTGPSDFPSWLSKKEYD